MEEIKKMTTLLRFLRKVKREHVKNDTIVRCMDDCYYKVLNTRERLYCMRKNR